LNIKHGSLPLLFLYIVCGLHPLPFFFGNYSRPVSVAQQTATQAWRPPIGRILQKDPEIHKGSPGIRYFLSRQMYRHGRRYHLPRTTYFISSVSAFAGSDVSAVSSDYAVSACFVSPVSSFAGSDDSAVSSDDAVSGFFVSPVSS